MILAKLNFVDLFEEPNFGFIDFVIFHSLLLKSLLTLLFPSFC